MNLTTLLLLLATGLLLQAAARATAGAGQECAATCAELQAQPLYEWSAGRAAAEAYQLPWNATYAFQPLDFVALSKEVCACLEGAGQGGGGASAS